MLVANTFLHLAVERGRAKAVDALLAAGADPDTRDKDGDTPLHSAVWRNDAKTVTALLAAGADVDAKDGRGRTPQDLAVGKAP